MDDAVKRCLRKTFTNELAQMYNWEGRCGKNALQNLHLIKVIFSKYKHIYRKCSRPVVPPVNFRFHRLS